MNERSDSTSAYQEAEQQNSTVRRSNSALPLWHDYFRVYINSFARYGVLTQAMLCAITSHTPSTARTALHDMAKAGYVQFHRTHGQVAYYLTPQGLALSEYSRFAKSPKAAFGTVRHDLVVNHIMTNAILNSKPPHSGVLRWLGPLEAKDELSQYYGFELTERSQRLNYVPDAYAEFYTSDPLPRLFRSVLEIDMGTETTSRVVRKLEAGIRTLAQKHDAEKYTLLWIFVDNGMRFNRVVDAMRDRSLEVRDELPDDRFPRILVRFVESDRLDSLKLPVPSPSLATGDSYNWAGIETDAPTLTDFVGVSEVYDKINKCKVLRTQIPALL